MGASFEAVRDAIGQNTSRSKDLVERAYMTELRAGIWWEERPQIKFRRGKPLWALLTGEAEGF